jgi:hypothetical protein
MSVARLAYAIDQGRRGGVRQESIQLAGDIAHLNTYGDKLINSNETGGLAPIGEDVNNILRFVSTSDEEQLDNQEKQSLREFCFSATVNARAVQGRLEKTQELEGK